MRFSKKLDGHVMQSDIDAIDQARVSFLTDIAHDMHCTPSDLKVLTSELALHIRCLVGDIDVNLDAPLPMDDEAEL
ncbi:hypothetical protein [Nitrincola sp.]|uniref:hypothetical protein n=1 Tax=Nitrincola sp. TaxID=1926584 RepID=UPI003A8D1A5E